MTETREQWIEREARKARERCGYDDWDSRNELTRDVWRNVVAPYYQEPLRVPVDVDGLADAIRRAEGHFWSWKDISEASQKGFRRCARAALAYLNIEPCEKPEYNPDDVALRPNERAELENLRDECERLRIQQPETRLEEKINCYGCGLALPKSALETGYNPIVDDVRVAVCQRCWDAGVGLQEKTAPAGVPSEWSDEDVEELAKVLYEAPDHHGDARDWTVASQYWRETSKNEARVALQWMAERGATVQHSTALDEALAKVERQRHQLNIKREAMESMLAEISKLDAECERLRQWQDDVLKVVNARMEVQ